ncbi:hypothetical protein ASPZODRAFT_71179 [Penicilliopsis zonata CBS 506.65]|uniref:Uncharacterized protein n=1 Tax=Penicilliopsis zonata CBS 506.65 TaxID=1073090 RepID=A0A1L9SBL2_9EURO|nr:hypothetical protein ASPZODRAFT_71179 [Penicilliopsis zonata CBS 506.65]OJJ44524.1 hypothetical protein ASPZODRAFT_71179 [Penicilliopsis zonata CBS 506.65]
MSLSWTCRAARAQVRGFSSSSGRRIGPESPYYIYVPRPVQTGLSPKPRVKGTLPVPRELFPARRPDKATPAYVADTAKAPSKRGPVDASGPHAAQIEWRRRLADTRRRNLQEGLGELYQRKFKTDSENFRRGVAKQKHRERILAQPEREDERLSRPSVIQDMLPHRMSILPDPDRESRLAMSQARTKAFYERKESERKENLHSLYMNARNFITTETQLAAEIDRVFPEGENEAWRNDHQQGDNVWNLGVPPTVQSMLTESKRNEASRWDLIQGRVKKLGEQITGGKI